MSGVRSLSSLLQAAQDLETAKRLLEERTSPLAVAFVDLCGSTELKQRDQKEWLPIVGRFLVAVARQVEAQQGKVVKFIGDEVFAVFPHPTGSLACGRAEAFVQECESALQDLGSEYVAKYALDFGRAATFETDNAPTDYLGDCVDRCARISKLTEPHSVLATSQFVAESRHSGSWKSVGIFNFKGIPIPTEVLQWPVFGQAVQVVDSDLQMRSSKELAREILALRKEILELRRR